MCQHIMTYLSSWCTRHLQCINDKQECVDTSLRVSSNTERVLALCACVTFYESSEKESVSPRRRVGC